MIWNWIVILTTALSTAALITIVAGVIYLLIRHIERRAHFEGDNLKQVVNLLKSHKGVNNFILYFCLTGACIFLILLAILIDEQTAPTVSAVAQVLAATGVLITALVALWSIRENRPLAIRAIERHSEDLKEILSNWAGEIEKFSPKNFESYTPQFNIEEDALFPDLVNHLPKLNNILEKWTAFKNDLSELPPICSKLEEEIIEYINQRFALKKGHRPKTECYSERLIDMIFEDSKSVASGQPQGWLEIIKKKSEVKVDKGRIDRYFIVDISGPVVWSEFRHTAEYVQDKLPTIFANIGIANTEEAHFVELAMPIIDLEKRLENHKEDILNIIKSLERIHIFPGECQYTRAIK